MKKPEMDASLEMRVVIFLNIGLGKFSFTNPKFESGKKDEVRVGNR